MTDKIMLHDEVKQQLTDRVLDVIEGRLKEYSLQTESFEMLLKMLRHNGWEMQDGDDIQTNGWDVDFWMTMRHDEKPAVTISGGVHSGNIKISLADEEDGD